MQESILYQAILEEGKLEGRLDWLKRNQSA